MANLIRLTPPASNPVTAETVMATAAVEDETQADRFERLIAAATELIQSHANFQLLAAEYRLDLGQWPCWQGRQEGIRLPRSNNAQVTGIEYKHPTTGVLTAWDPANYQVVTRAFGVSEIWPIARAPWPSVLDQSTDAIQITFTSGVADIDDLPALAVTAVEQLAIFLYEHPSGSCDLPPGIQTLMRSFRIVDADLDRQMAEELR